MPSFAVTEPNGILALWNDCQPGQEAFYEHWYQTEHLHERLAVPGFLRGRRYQALQGSPRYFTYYETQTPAVLTSPAYIARLNDPTPATRRVMDGLFTDMSRTICRVVSRVGVMRGAVAVTAKLNAAVPSVPGGNPIMDLPARLVGDGQTVVRAELWQAVDTAGSEPTAEEKLRGGDQKIQACLLVELLRADDVNQLHDVLNEALGGAIDTIGSYQLLCEYTASGDA